MTIDKDTVERLTRKLPSNPKHDRRTSVGVNCADLRAILESLAQPTEQTDDAVVEAVDELIRVARENECAAHFGRSHACEDLDAARAAVFAAMPTGQTNRLDQPAVHPYAAVCYRREGDGWKQVSVTQSEHDLEAAMDIGIAKLESRQ